MSYTSVSSVFVCLKCADKISLLACSIVMGHNLIWGYPFHRPRFLSPPYAFSLLMYRSLSPSLPLSLFFSHALFRSSLLSHFSMCTQTKGDWRLMVFLPFSSMFQPFCATVSTVNCLLQAVAALSASSIFSFIVFCSCNFKVYISVWRVLQGRDLLEFVGLNVLYKVENRESTSESSTVKSRLNLSAMHL